MRVGNRIRALLGSFALLACTPEETPAVMTQEDKRLLDEIRARAAERLELTTHPGRLLRVQKVATQDRGIVNTYTKAVALTFSNDSRFDVTDPIGKVTYFDAHGNEMATVPFAAKGHIAAGARDVELTAESREITGGARKWHGNVEKVSVSGN